MTSSRLRTDRTIACYGVIGYPVKHSLSPLMQNAAFNALNIPANYMPLEIKPADLPAFLKKLNKSVLSGVNLTVPHKEIAFRCLSNLSKEARETGTVNTIKVSKGKLSGFSTDAYGLLTSLKEDFRLKTLEGKSVLLLGSGGAATAVSASIARSGIKALFIANRTYEKALVLAAKTRRSAKIPCIALPLDDSAIKSVIPGIDILINATSSGLKKGDRSPVSSKALRKGLLVYDMIYNPAITPLMKEAKKVGAKAKNGLGMLLYQGAKSFEIWTGRKAPVKVMRKALEAK